MNSVYELIMLICFGISWPFAALKSYKSRSTKGKSLLFLIAIWIGYVSGILHKVLYSQDLVIIVYIFNLTVVSIDLLLYVRNRRLEK
jgi:hypothetical protein